MDQSNKISGVSTQAYVEDERNKNVLVYVNGEFFPTFGKRINI